MVMTDVRKLARENNYGESAWTWDGNPLGGSMWESLWPKRVCVRTAIATTYAIERNDDRTAVVLFNGLLGIERLAGSLLYDLIRDRHAQSVPTPPCIRVWVDYLDYGAQFRDSAGDGKNDPMVRYHFRTWLVLRVDAEHPFWGSTAPGYLIVRTHGTHHPTDPPTVLAQLTDEAVRHRTV